MITEFSLLLSTGMQYNQWLHDLLYKFSSLEDYRDSFTATIVIVKLLLLLSTSGDKPEALFQWKDGIPLAKSKFVEAVSWALSAAHLPAQDYADHNFWIGAATTTAMAGVEDSTI